MIKFFRKIRQSLLSENKFSKYLLYAIGEIFLVVIGILIALQINNWNKEHQDRKLERVNLLALQKEFQENIGLLDEVVALNSRIISGAEKTIQIFQTGALDTISDRYMALNLNDAISVEINFAPKSGVLTEIVSSGNLKLIRNDELKHKLAGYGSWIDRVEQQEDEVNQFRKSILEFLNVHGNTKKAFTDMGRKGLEWESPMDSRSNKQLFQSNEFLNRLISFKAASEGTTRFLYQPLKTEMEDLLILIDSELQK